MPTTGCLTQGYEHHEIASAGHSIGGYLAVALTLQLPGRGEAPGCAALWGSNLPSPSRASHNRSGETCRTETTS
jgi:thioesterase domain-containing protein